MLTEITDPNAPIDGDDVQESILYYDGLGRPLQEVGMGISPNQKDMVTFHEYDNLGRENKSYLPYADNSQDGSFKLNVVSKQASFYKDALKVAHTSFPYSRVEYDGAGNVVKQGDVGYFWQPDEHAVERDFAFNTTSDNIRKWVISTDGSYCSSAGIYGNNTLYVETTTDENGIESTTYTDRNGLRVATEKLNDGSVFRTYLVYDDFSRLVFEIPTKAVELMNSTQSWNTSTLSEDLIYHSFYDRKGRLVKKKIPGRDIIDYVYNDRDQLIMTQDGNLRGDNKWSFTKYDILGNVIMTGICAAPNITGFNSVQEMVDSHYNTVDGDNYEVFTGDMTTNHGYTNITIPIFGTNDQVYSIAYFGNYDFVPTGFRDSYYPISGFDNKQAEQIIGVATGSKVLVLDGTSTYLYTANFYDDRGRLIQSYGHNQFQNGYDEITFSYDFVGKVLKSRHVQSATISSTNHLYTLQKRYEYDHAGRLKKEFHKFNDQPEVLIKSLDYNELGQVIEKNIHSMDNGVSFLQSIDLAYNIRGWLSKINQSNLQNDMHFLPEDDNLDAMEVVEAIEIDEVDIEFVLVTGTMSGSNKLKIEITDYKDIELGGGLVLGGETRKVIGDEAEIFILYENILSDSISYNTLLSLAGNTYTIDFGRLRIEQSTSMLDVITQIAGFLDVQMPQQGVSDDAKISETNLFVAMHILNSLGASYLNEDTDDLFGMDILYNQGLSDLGGAAQYNGNISGIKWQTNGNNTGIRGYGFQYDDWNQLTDASYAKHTPLGWNEEVDRYSVSNITYDANGNILSLDRDGLAGSSTYGAMDNLSYAYDGNQLSAVNDAIGDFAFNGHDFRDGNSTGSNEYTYDANGNMVSDANKGIVVSYNYLNLPEEVDFGNGNKITYLYTSSGNRIKKTVETSGQSSEVMHYAGSYTYKGSGLQMIKTSEGRIRKETTTYKYEYSITDHLGNVRVMFGDDGTGTAEMLQEDHYYPFGLTYMGELNYNYGTVENKYLYQGKELQEDHNLHWHDFGARMYDAQIGRWHCADPMTQYSSPYLAMGNNPVNAIDPNGMYVDKIRGVSSTGQRLYNYMSYMRNKGYTWDSKLHFWFGGPGSIGGDAFSNRYSIDDIIWGISNYAGVEASMHFKMKEITGTLIDHFQNILAETAPNLEEISLEEYLAEQSGFETIMLSAMETGFSYPDSEDQYKFLFEDHTERFEKFLEYTAMFFSSMASTLDQFIENNPKAAGTYIKHKVFISLVKPGAFFDIKETLFSKEAIGGNEVNSVAWFHNDLFQPQDFGNYNFGVAAKAYGYTENFSIKGAGLAQIFYGNGFHWHNLKGLGDYTWDTDMIIRGYYHF
jgi:RHS repeat-associated protein